MLQRSKHEKLKILMNVFHILHERLYLIKYNLCSYKNVSKTDVKCTWITHPKSIPHEVQTINDLYPESNPNFRLFVHHKI